MNVFELNQAFEDVKNRLENGDIDESAAIDTLESIEADRDTKLDNVATWYDHNKADIDFLTYRIRELQQAKRALENRNNNLMSYMTSAIDQAGLKEVKTEHHMLKPRNYRASTVIADESQLPDFYKTTVETVKVDKTAIYNALKNGVEVPGAHLEPNRKTVIK